MLWSFLSLWLAIKLFQLIGWCIRAFWAWLGRGRLVEQAVERELVSDEVAAAVATIQRIRAAEELGVRDPGELPVEHMDWETPLGERKRAPKHMADIFASATFADDEDIKQARKRRKPIRLTRAQRAEVRRAERIIREDFLDGIDFTWFHAVMIFFIGSILGLILEEVWMFVTAGLTESRVGLVWGPYSPLYGFGALLLTAATFRMRREGARGWQVFLASMLIGGILEQATGWAMETLLGAVSWDYIAGGVPGALSKWVAVPFLFIWGLLGYLWYRFIMPELLFNLGTPSTRRKVVFVSLLGLYLALDIFMTVMCFGRRAARDAGVPPSNRFEEWVDENFSDTFMSERFQNLVIETTGDAASSMLE